MSHYLSLSSSQHIFAADDNECCFSWLMKDVLLLIFQNLSVRDAGSAFRACRAFRRCSLSAPLWKRLYENSFGGGFVVDKFSSLFQLEAPAASAWHVGDTEQVVVKEEVAFPDLAYRWLARAACVRAGTPSAMREAHEQPQQQQPVAAAPEAGDAAAVEVNAVNAGQAEGAEDGEKKNGGAGVSLNLRDGLGTFHSEHGTYCGLWRDGHMVLGLYAPPTVAEAEGARGKKESDQAVSRPVFTYGGEVRDRRWEGVGVTTFSSGGHYMGDFCAGELHGHGHLIYKEGDEYEGEWVRNVKHGYGVYRWASGNTYVGQWAENRREGKIGELHWANGDKYSGEWLDNRRTGVGVLRWSQARGGGVYEGNFLDNMLHGIGTFHFREMRYEGNWQCDRREGAGKLIWADGDEYEGNWTKGARSGAGVFREKTNGGAEVCAQEWNEPADVKYSQSTPLKYPASGQKKMAADAVQRRE